MNLEARNRYIQLGWQLLEAKVRYYEYPLFENILDSTYDQMEIEYLKLCNEYGFENTVQSVVGVGVDRPCLDAVRSKILVAKEDWETFYGK